MFRRNQKSKRFLGTPVRRVPISRKQLTLLFGPPEENVWTFQDDEGELFSVGGNRKKSSSIRGTADIAKFVAWLEQTVDKAFYLPDLLNLRTPKST